MSTSDNCKEGASKSNEDDGLCEMNMLQNMSMDDKDVVVSACANCGKEGSNNDMNTCNKCKMVKYCNAVCKKVHKKKHKKDCEEHVRLATEKHDEELRIAAELHDEKLFKQPPPGEDCSICFLLLPSLDPTGKKYMACCGKRICSGCNYAPVYDNQGNTVAEKTCPFCRVPTPYTIGESLEREKKRVEANDPIAIYNKGIYHRNGIHGYPQDYNKALEYWHRAGELGHPKAYNNIGYAYDIGMGVEVDKEKAKYYTEQAAMRGDEIARHNLGNNERRDGNMDRALKHYIIAVGSGLSESLEIIKLLYSKGQATKEEYTTALQLYQTYLGKIKSEQRDEAAAVDDQFRYY